MNSKRTLHLLALFACLAMASTLRADDGAVYARGFRPNGVYAVNDFDAVNAYNGNLMLNVPLGPQYHSNGTLAYQFQLHYDSHAWDLFGYEGVSFTTADFRTSPFDTGIFYYYSYWPSGTVGVNSAIAAQSAERSPTAPAHAAPRRAIAAQSFDPDGPPPDVSGLESVAHGNAGMGWTFGLGELKGSRTAIDGGLVSYSAPDGQSSRFATALHGAPDIASAGTVFFSTDSTYLRLRFLQQNPTGTSDLAEVDFPDGIRKRFRCVQDCNGGRTPRWLLDVMSDPHGNFLTIDYSDTNGNDGAVQPPANGFWKWTITEWSRQDADTGSGPQYSDGSADTRHASTAIRTHYAYFGSRHALEVRLERLALAAPNGRLAFYDFTYTETRIPSEVGLPWPQTGGGLLVPYETDVVDGKTVALRGVSQLLAVKLPRPAGFTATAPPCMQPCSSDPAVAGVWQFRYQNDLPPESEWEAPVAGWYYLTKFDAGRLRMVKTPAGAGFRYEYDQRAFPVLVCGARTGQHAIVLTSVAKRQQIDAVEHDIPNAAWFYLGQGWLDNRDIGVGQHCFAAREFIAAVIAPPPNTPVADCPGGGTNCYGPNPSQTRISLSFFSGLPRRQGISFEHMAWPYTEEELLCPDTTPCAGMDTAKYLHTREVSGDYATFAADPKDAVRRIFPRLTRSGETPTTVQVLRETYSHYESSLDSCQNGPGANCLSSNLRPRLERQIFYDDAARPYIETTWDDFDGLGHFRTTAVTNDFQVASFTDGKVESKTTTQQFNPAVVYQAGGTLPLNAPATPDPWFLNRYTLLTTQETDGNIAGPIFARRATFDDGRAFLRTMRTYANAGASPTPDDTNDLVEQTDRLGMLINNVPQVRVRRTSSGGYSGAPVYTDDTYLQYGAMRSHAYVDPSGGNVQTIETNTPDQNTGVPLSIADGSGATSFYSYDALSHPTAVTPPSGTEPPGTVPPATGTTPQTYEYHYATEGHSGNEGPGQAIGATTLHISQTLGPDQLYTFDLLGRVAQQDEGVPGGKTNTQKSLYNAAGQVLTEIETPPNGGPASVTTKHTFDELGRDTTTKLPDGRTLDHIYNGTRDIVVKNQVGMGGSGLTTAFLTDDRDGFGRLRKANDGITRAEYTYDALDHLTLVKVIDVANKNSYQQRWFTYDPRGLMLSEQHPELGTAGNASVHHEKIDARGHVHRFTYADASRNISFFYDGAERLTDVAGANGALKHFDYYADGQTQAAGTRGKVQTSARWNYLPIAGGVTDGTPAEVDEQYQYDYAGRPASVIFGSTYGRCFNIKTTYHYDDLGNIAKVDYPAFTTQGGAGNAPSRTVQMTYGNGRLIGVGTTADPFSFASLAYFFNGTESKVTRQRGSATFADSVTADTNGMARPGGYTWQYAGGSATTGLYGYDGAGNVISIGTDSYTYDAGMRLTRATIDNRVRSYTYDPFGNIQQWRDETANHNHPFTTDLGTNHLTGAGYDPLGNLASLADPRPAHLFPPDATRTLSFVYDPLSSLTHYEGAGIGRSYLYDADDERVAVLDYAAEGDSTHTLHEHWSVRGPNHTVLRDFDRTGLAWSWVEDYVYRGTTLASTIVGNESVRDVHTDHLGSTRFLTDATGAFVVTNGVSDTPRKYWPFGELTVTRPLDDRMAFTGHERDEDGTNLPDADLDYMHARYYGAVMGRFLSADPVSGDPARPQSWNRYAYVENNPLSHRDPTGRCGEPSFLGPQLPCPLTDPDNDTGKDAPGVSDFFLFASIAATTDTPIRPAAELVPLFGYNDNDGFYLGLIYAFGVETGTPETYAGKFWGAEWTTAHRETEGITLKELSGGPGIPFVAGAGLGGGTYQTGKDTGGFIYASGGAIGQEGALGFGFNSQFLKEEANKVFDTIHHFICPLFP